MDVAMGAAISVAVQSAQVRHRLAIEMVKQQQQQMQAVTEMLAAATGSSAVPGRGDSLDILV